MQIVTFGCFCVIASCVLIQIFLKSEYVDFFGYLTNTIIYFVHLPFITVVLLSDTNQIPRSVVRYYPIVVALGIGVWFGVQCICILQTNDATYDLLTMKESVSLGIGVVYNEIVHTLPVVTYALVYMTNSDQICAVITKQLQWIDVVVPTLVTVLFSTLNPNIDAFYRLNRQGVWIAGGTSLVTSLLSVVIVRHSLNKKVNI